MKVQVQEALQDGIDLGRIERGLARLFELLLELPVPVVSIETVAEKVLGRVEPIVILEHVDPITPVIPSQSKLTS